MLMITNGKLTMFKSNHAKYRIGAEPSFRQRSRAQTRIQPNSSSRANITLLALKLLTLISIAIVIYYVGIITNALLNQLVQSIAHSLLHDLFRLIR